VLRPAGRLAVFWNAGQPPPDLTDAFAAAYRRAMPDSLAARGRARPAVDSYSMLCEQAAAGIRQANGFSDPEQWRFDWNRSYTRDEWLDQVPTGADHSQFPPAQLEDLLAAIGAAIDAVGGSFTIDYATVVATATRTDVA
jgi:hypothetical protein